MSSITATSDDIDAIKIELPSSYENIKTNEKSDEEFRVYRSEDTPQRVIDHYRDMRSNQTVDFTKKWKGNIILQMENLGVS